MLKNVEEATQAEYDEDLKNMCICHGTFQTSYKSVKRVKKLKIRDAHHEAASMPLRQHISSPKTKGSSWYVLLVGSEERGSSCWLGSHHSECTTTGMRQRQRLRSQGFISGVPSSTPAQQSSSGTQPRVVVIRDVI
ncbi:hypothetical protein Bca4012_004795 [Brassica carinata]